MPMALLCPPQDGDGTTWRLERGWHGEPGHPQREVVMAGVLVATGNSGLGLVSESWVADGPLPQGELCFQARICHKVRGLFCSDRATRSHPA